MRLSFEFAQNKDNDEFQSVFGLRSVVYNARRVC